MNNFIPVARFDRGFDPLRSRENLEIALDGNPVGRQTKVGKQAGNFKPFGDFARFAIHYNLDIFFHHETGAGLLSRGFAFKRKRNSP